MPTYDYVCRACGYEFELFQMMSDAVKRTCPKCKKARLERLIGTGAGVIFKGSGFYETDYRSESYKKAAEAESKAASPAPATGDSKTEVKSDAAKADSTGEKSSAAAPRDTPAAGNQPAASGRSGSRASAQKNSSKAPASKNASKRTKGPARTSKRA